MRWFILWKFVTGFLVLLWVPHLWSNTTLEALSPFLQLCIDGKVDITGSAGQKIEHGCIFYPAVWWYWECVEKWETGDTLQEKCAIRRTKYWFAFLCQNLFQILPLLPFYFNKAKEWICSLTQLFRYILKLIYLWHVQLREIRCGEEGKRKPLGPLWALKSISLYF